MYQHKEVGHWLYGKTWRLLNILEIKKQQTISRSSAEAEYSSLVALFVELVWLARLLKELHVPIMYPIPIFTDRKLAIQIAKNPIFHKQTKHIEIDCHVIREKVKFNSISPQYLCTALQLADILTKVSSLEEFVKNFEKSNVSGELTDLEVQIKEVANIVEQTIQLGVTEAILENDENLREKAQERLSDSLQQVAEDIDRIWKESTNIQDKENGMNFQWFKIFQCFMIFQLFNIFEWFSKTSKEYTNVENSMVGHDDQRKRLVEDLTRSYSSEPKVIPIVGMGGIGKTTLANEVYNNESILRHFYVRAWATVSQQQNIKKILLSLLQSTIKMDDTVKTKGEAELPYML
ncbi:hypothetical protein T459_24246 [Capsicum annuum]|uniref:NB-ARC domain-containing protein n=1 Tax=Capsicum annuum TaxID=4072 RepID=A0A2G2YV00_CAPAN|nr:hypothetical protein T459_24246 [Capsicum annuum]